MYPQWLDIKENTGLYPVTLSGAANGDTIVDMQGYERALVVCFSGAVTTDVVFELKHGDASNLSDAAAVGAADLNGTEPTLAAATDNEVAIFEYTGNKRYIRIDATAGAGIAGAVILLYKGRHKPYQSQ